MLIQKTTLLFPHMYHGLNSMGLACLFIQKSSVASFTPKRGKQALSKSTVDVG